MPALYRSAKARRQREERLHKLFSFIMPVVAVLAEQVANDQDKKKPGTPKTWEELVGQVGVDSAFERYYRMSLSSFHTLLDVVSPHIHLDIYQSKRRTSGQEPISAAVMLQCCLRWLAGGTSLDLLLIARVSRANFYRIVHKVMDAINTVSELAPKFPSTNPELKVAAQGFASRSSSGILQGCIGAINGWLCPIRVPRKRECGRVISFFSGLYQRYGLNVQACADHNSKITAFSVSCPGGMNDARAYRRWGLSEAVLKFPSSYYVVADNAYTQSVSVMTPFNRVQAEGDIEKDSYNYFLSQLRIRVEVAFGLLVNQWRILKTPLAVKLSRCHAVISVSAFTTSS